MKYNSTAEELLFYVIFLKNWNSTLKWQQDIIFDHRYILIKFHPMFYHALIRLMKKPAE